MLSKKRPILFDVLGHRSKAVRVSVTGSERSSPAASSPEVRSRALWAGLALVLLVAIGFAAWRLKRPGSRESPALQSSVRDPASQEAGPDGTHVYAVCVWSRDYRNKTERRLAADKVHEIVNFLGYHSDPELRDVRGLDRPGRDLETGTFRIYVGSANDRTSLLGLCKQVAGVSYKKERPFQNARIVRVERDAPPGSKEASDER